MPYLLRVGSVARRYNLKRCQTACIPVQRPGGDDVYIPRDTLMLHITWSPHYWSLQGLEWRYRRDSFSAQYPQLAGKWLGEGGSPAVLLLACYQVTLRQHRLTGQTTAWTALSLLPTALNYHISVLSCILVCECACIISAKHYILFHQHPNPAHANKAKTNLDFKLIFMVKFPPASIQYYYYLKGVV